MVSSPYLRIMSTFLFLLTEKFKNFLGYTCFLNCLQPCEDLAVLQNLLSATFAMKHAPTNVERKFPMSRKEPYASFKLTGKRSAWHLQENGISVLDTIVTYGASHTAQATHSRFGSSRHMTTDD